MSRDAIDRAMAAIAAPMTEAREAAIARQAQLTKPPCALGRMEELHTRVAAIRREPAPALGAASIIVAAADAGVADEGVSAYPQAVTVAMVRNMLDGGAAVNVLARRAGANVIIVDCGVAEDINDARLVIRKRGRGAANIAREPAMSREDAEWLIAEGIALAGAAADRGDTAIGLGDMGIANTTTAATVTAVMTGASVADITGRGTGVDDAGLRTKIAVIERALDLHEPDPRDPIAVVAAIGGCETALLAGVIVGAAARSLPVMLDGYPTTAAALIAAALAPATRDYMLASHVSAEPGHRTALAHLGLRPLLDLEMRLGEGTGAALALMLLNAALAIPREMATFASAGVPAAVRDGTRDIAGGR